MDSYTRILERERERERAALDLEICAGSEAEGKERFGRPLPQAASVRVVNRERSEETVTTHVT